MPDRKVIKMTLEELKAKYQELADACEKRGDEYRNQAQELVAKGDSEKAIRYYGKANSEYHNAAMYTDFVIDLCQIER